jgi:hypothetical protein
MPALEAMAPREPGPSDADAKALIRRADDTEPSAPSPGTGAPSPANAYDACGSTSTPRSPRQALSCVRGSAQLHCRRLGQADVVSVLSIRGDEDHASFFESSLYFPNYLFTSSLWGHGRGPPSESFKLSRTASRRCLLISL